LNIGKDQEIHEIAEKNNFLSWQGTKHKAGPPQAATGAGIDRQDAGPTQSSALRVLSELCG